VSLQEVPAYDVSYRAAGDGPELYSVDATVTVKCRAAETGGGYELFEVDAPRGALVPPHTEPWPKAFYVLHGRMNVRAGDRSYDLGPGDFVTVPPGAVNTFAPQTPSVKFLTFSLGDGLGNFFADIDRSAPREGSVEDLMPVIGAVTARNHVTIVDGPQVVS
jgi:quercetin dioxygenase-like cupin family protein